MFTDVLAPDAPTSETGLDQSSIVNAQTFDGFAYELRIGKLMGENYPVLVSVKAEVPKERKPAADENPEDRARLDQEFATKQKQREEKLAKEQAFTGRPYLIAKGTIDVLLQKRSDLLKPPPTPTPSPSPTAKASPAHASSPAQRPKSP